ncbi:MAG TPA: ABC transporter permease [Firmicutes bacterium]|jgi:cell division transport system permease protein|nr:ABC transporter permease [Bacillota bacterium]
MHIRSLFYFLGEALKSVVRHGWMSIASIAVVAMTLFILGCFIVLNFNVASLAEDIKEQVQIVVRVEDGIDEQTREELQRRLVLHPELEEVRFVSKDEAMERLKIKMGDRAYLLEGYTEEDVNPLRDSYELQMKVPENISVVAGEIEGYPGVDYVDFGEGIVEPLFQFTGIVRWIGLAFMIGLALTAVFLIAHTIRLTVFIRRREIQIMKYVGATNWFIRWPFIFEGLILGLVGAALPVFIIQVSYQAAVEWIGENIYFVSLLPAEQMGSEVAHILIPLGVILGTLGSTMSVRRFLNV